MNQKKNAFTLIELLAVIVILAIIALIAVPVIMNIINKANKSAFKDTAYGIINAGELYFAEQQLEPTGMSKDVTIKLPDTTKTLELKGEVPTGKMLITKEGKIALAVSNGRYCITKSVDDKDITVTEDYETCELPSGGSSSESGNIMDNEWPITWKQSDVEGNTSFEMPLDDSKSAFITLRKVSDLTFTPDNLSDDFDVIVNDGTEDITVYLSSSTNDEIGWFFGAMSLSEKYDVLFHFYTFYVSGTYEGITIPEPGLYYGVYEYNADKPIDGVDFQFNLKNGD